MGRHTDVVPTVLGTLSGAGLGAAASGHPLGAIPGAIVGGLTGRAVGRFSQGMVSGAAHAHPVKEAGVERASGIRRGLQLLTGSRARALEGQAADRGKVLARNIATGDRVFKESTFREGVSDALAHRAIHASERGIRGAGSGQARAARAATAERAEVGKMRRAAGEAVLGVGAGAGAGALATRQKTAGKTTGLAATVAAGSKKIRAATEAVQEKVIKNNTPLLTGRQKLIGSSVATGLGAGALLHHHHNNKTAALSLHREEQIKEAFGAALMQGLKGMGQFAGVAGKSVANAARTGGMPAVGHAAMNVGRSGLMRATNFVAKNPAAGMALAAAPALAAGYAAGRQ